MVQVKMLVSKGMSDSKERTVDHSYAGTIQGDSARFCYLGYNKPEKPTSPLLGRQM